MANRTIADVLKIHQEFVKSIEERLEPGGKPKPVTRKSILRQKEGRLSAMQARLASAEQEKRALVERIDRQISGLQKKIQRFEKEIEADRKNLDRQREPDRPDPDRPDPDSPDPRRPDRVPVREIRGIGEASEARLRAHGITDAGQVAKMKDAKLAEILGITKERAAEFIKAAKRLERR